MNRSQPIEAYPLAWPVGRPRSKHHEHARFKTSFGRARDKCRGEIYLLGGRDVIISTNIPLKRDGYPYADSRANVGDTGVAVYFTYKKRQMCFACDRYWKAEDNMHAISLTIGALRGVARYDAAHDGAGRRDNLRGMQRAPGVHRHACRASIWCLAGREGGMMGKGRELHATNKKDQCEAITQVLNGINLRCPLYFKLVISNKRLCARHGQLEALAVLIAQGKAQIIPRPETRIPWQAVKTIEKQGGER